MDPRNPAYHYGRWGGQAIRNATIAVPVLVPARSRPRRPILSALKAALLPGAFATRAPQCPPGTHPMLVPGPPHVPGQPDAPRHWACVANAPTERISFVYGAHR